MSSGLIEVKVILSQRSGAEETRDMNLMNTLTWIPEETAVLPQQNAVEICISQWNESEFAVSISARQPFSLIAQAASQVANQRARIFSRSSPGPLI